jgi:hypothetical protein
LVEAKSKKTQNLSKTTTKKQVNSLVPKARTTTVITYNHMAIIQIQIGNNTIEDVLLDGGFGVNIITEHLRLRLGLLKPKSTPYCHNPNLKLVTRTKACKDAS